MRILSHRVASGREPGQHVAPRAHQRLNHAFTGDADSADTASGGQEERRTPRRTIRVIGEIRGVGVHPLRLVVARGARPFEPCLTLHTTLA